MKKKVFVFTLPTVVRVDVYAESTAEAARLLKEDITKLQEKHGGSLLINPNHKMYRDMRIGLDPKIISSYKVLSSYEAEVPDDSEEEEQEEQEDQEEDSK